MSDTGARFDLGSVFRKFLQVLRSTVSLVKKQPSSGTTSTRSTKFRSQFPSFPTSKRKNDSWLRVAALLSIFMHLGLLILLPAPGNRGTLPAQRVKVDVRFRSPPPPEPIPTEVEEIQPLLEEDPPETEIEDKEIADIAPKESPQEVLNNAGTSPVPEMHLDGPATPEISEEDGEIQKIQSLLTDTRDQVLNDKARDRWLLLEVREPIRTGLTQLLGQGMEISDSEGSGKFLLSFWIDGEGWIYDLALKPAPGVEIDAFGIRDMIARLNPLANAPAGVKTPLKSALRVQSLE